MPTLSELKAKARRLRLEQLFKAQQKKITEINSEFCPPCESSKKQSKHLGKRVNKPTSPKPAITLIVPAPPKNLRNHDYNLAFEQGTAVWYHLPCQSVHGYADEQIQQVRFCALGTTSAGMGERAVHYVWRVKSVRKLPRHYLTIVQSGALKASDQPYWLFEFDGAPIRLSHPLIGFPQHFSLKLSLFSELTRVSDWNEIVELAQKEFV